jgi:hypothetical protein
MANKINPAMFTAPIPGMSLTTEKGNRPWERPPQFTTIEEVFPFYMKSLGNKTFLLGMFNALEAGVPITILVDTMITAAVAEGKHTLDVGVLISPIMVEAFIRLAEKADIDYVSGLEDEDEDGQLSRSAVKRVINKAFNAEEITPEQLDMREEAQDVVEDIPTKGLMAKRGDK